MQLVIVLLLVVALGLLVLGLVGSSPTLIVLSIVTSAVVGVLLVRSRRGRADRADRRATQPVTAHAASDLIEAQRTAEVIEVPEEPPAANTEAPLRAHGNDVVAVIDGHPRYHAQRCRYLLGRASEAIPLRQAVEDGFTPCSMCDPDVVLAAAPTATGGED